MKDIIQKSRRRILATVRNELLYNSLNGQSHVLWIDADVKEIPPHVPKKMIDSGLDIIGTMTLARDGNIFDRNTWKGPRVKPTKEQLENIAKGEIFVPKHDRGCLFLDELSKNTSSPFVEVDSVGGTVLLVKAEVHLRGISFPPFTTIGNDWEYEGYDGIETEGLCYTAKFLGYKCWGLTKEKIFHV